MNPDSAMNRVTIMEHIMFVQICVYSYGGGEGITVCTHSVLGECM